MDKTISSKPIAVISEWRLVTINYELRIRKTCVDFYFRKNQGINFLSNKSLELIKVSSYQVDI